MAAWCEGPLLGIDFETTGVDPTTDLPVQAALVWCGQGGTRRRVWTVDPGREIPPAAIAVHGISTEKARREGRSLAETAAVVHHFLGQAMHLGVPVVAMNASFDVTIAECLFSAAGLPGLSWSRVVDPLVLDRHLDGLRAGKRRLEDLCAHYGVPLVKAHSADHDAEAAVSIAREIGRRWPATGRTDAAMLTVLQASWHRTWVAGFDCRCRAEGRGGLEDSEYLWPLRLQARSRRLQPSLPAGLSRAGSGRPWTAASQFASDSSTTSTSCSLERGLTTARRIAVSPW